jgi:hypothetical protein
MVFKKVSIHGVSYGELQTNCSFEDLMSKEVSNFNMVDAELD